jgi:hypothetical protein
MLVSSGTGGRSSLSGEVVKKLAQALAAQADW